MAAWETATWIIEMSGGDQPKALELQEEAITQTFDGAKSVKRGRCLC